MTAAAAAAAAAIKPIYFISITGLELKSIFHYPLFLYYAVPAMTQAKSAAGNIHADAKGVLGIQHTFTVWQKKADMLDYLHKGAHLQALKASRKVGAYGKMVSFESDTIPADWSEIRRIWDERGRVSFGDPKPGDLTTTTTTTTTTSTSTSTSSSENGAIS
jgi:hypothetical protein